ncbi:long-chain-fatty-acid--CoA ligase [Streptomyces sp. NPDC055078]
MTNAVEPVWKHAARSPGAPALRTDGSVWSYAEVAGRADAFRARLSDAGVRPGSRVLLVAPTGPDFVFAYLGILAHGAVAVTVNPQCTSAELQYFLRDAGCALAVAAHETSDVLREAAAATGVAFWQTATEAAGPGPGGRPGRVHEVTGGAAAVLLYTSGTTGRPKGAVLTHANLTAAAGIYAEVLGLRADDRVGTALPLFHVFGQVAVLLMAVHAGASVSLLHPFSGGAMLRMAAEHRLTVVSGVPTMWNEMLHADSPVRPDQLTGLRLAASGGAALPREVMRAFEERFGTAILEGYALSETSAAAAFNRPGRRVREGSVGQALPGLRVTVLDDEGQPLPAGQVGEIAVRGPVVTSGYWRRPEATAQATRNGWFRTGDMGRMDEEGYLWVVDRKKDMIIRGGYNVYPREIEEVLYEHPAVREAAVVGVPDDRLGEEVAAVVVLDPLQAVEFEELRAWLARRLASYKLPRLYHTVPSLPRGSTGKLLKQGIDRAELRLRARRVRLVP